MDDILTDGRKLKTVDSSDENGLGNMKKERREAEPGVEHSMGSFLLWSQLSTTAQRSHSYTGSTASL